MELSFLHCKELQLGEVFYVSLAFIMFSSKINTEQTFIMQVID